MISIAFILYIMMISYKMFWSNSRRQKSQKVNILIIHFLEHLINESTDKKSRFNRFELMKEMKSVI